jgi:hypothetical protein
MRIGGSEQVAEEKTKLAAENGEKSTQNLPLLNPTKIMENKNKLYFHPSNKSS